MPNKLEDQREPYRARSEIQPSLVIVQADPPITSPTVPPETPDVPVPPVEPQPNPNTQSDPIVEPNTTVAPIEPVVDPTSQTSTENAQENPTAASTVNPITPTNPTIPEKTPPTQPTTLACRQVNNLNDSSAIALREWLKQSNTSIEVVEKRDSGKKTWVVLYPPSKNAGEAQTAANQLRKKGVDDLFIISQKGAQQFGISLGVFSSEAGANQAKAEFEAKGISPLSIYTRDTARYQFIFNNLTDSQLSFLTRNPQYTQNGLVNCKK